MNKPTSVLGEAPESDDEYDEKETDSEVVYEKCDQLTDNEVIDELCSEDTKLMDNVNIKIKDESHAATIKILRDKNMKMYESSTYFKSQILNSSNNELEIINQLLLKSQIDLQHSLTNLHRIKKNLINYKGRFDAIINANYIPKINIAVPPRVIQNF